MGYGGHASYSGGGGGGGYYGGGGAFGSGGGGGGSSYLGNDFTVGVPIGLPDNTDQVTDLRDGFAVVSFLGSRYMAGDVENMRLPLPETGYTPQQIIKPDIEEPEYIEIPDAEFDTEPESDHDHEFELDDEPETSQEQEIGSEYEDELQEF